MNRRFILTPLSLVFHLGLSPLFAQTIAINEIQLSPISELTEPWMELRNTGFEELTLTGYSVSFQKNLLSPTPLPNITIGPNEYAAIDLPENYQDTINHVYLLDSQGKVVDSVYIPSSIMHGESFGRFPEYSASFVFFSESKVSRGGKNFYPGPWVKLTNRTSFSPRDSAPNAMIVHDNKFWIFEGWEHIYSDVYDARSNLWVSTDMVNWKLVNDNPPYDPYCAFASYKGKMWAFGRKCWSSQDGLTWVEEASYFPGALTAQVAIFRDTLWFSKAKSIGYSINGKDWNFSLAASAPWESRSWPGFVAFKDKLWFFGGGNGYGTSTPEYYNDVWSSKNGKDWELVAKASWPGRFWFSWTVFDDKLWLFGGYDLNKLSVEFGNLNDTWYTEDGITWKEFKSDNLWGARHAQFTVTTDSAAYISSGYGGGSLDRLYNDVWKFSVQKPRYFEIDSINMAYGDIYDLEPFWGPDAYALSVQNNSIAEVVEGSLKSVHAGTTKVRIVTLPTNNYYQNDTIIQVNVQKRGLHAATQPVSKIFGEENPAFEISYSGFAYGDSPSDLQAAPTVSTPATIFSPAGSYPVNLAGGDDDNYNLILEEGVLIVEPSAPVMFPNPASDNIYLYTAHCDDNQPIFFVEIIDQTGRTIKELSIDCKNQERIPIADIPNGVYVTKIRTANATYLKRLAIK